MAIRVIPQSAGSLLPPTPGRKSHRFTWWASELLKYTLLIFLAASFILPLYWMLISSVKNDAQIYTIPPIWIPNPVLLENFYNAWTKLPFTTYLYNTVVLYAIPATFGTVISSAVVAYGFARIRFAGRDLLFGICLATMMVPFQVTMVPLFIIFKNLGWRGTFLPLVVPAFFGNPYFIFLLRQFFRTVPDELSDSGRIDGANELQILWNIILPLARPALAVVGLFAFMGAWNDYLGPLIYVNNKNLYTMSMGINELRSLMGTKGIGASMAYPFLMSVSTLITLPILTAFFFSQRTFIEGITLTGLKG